MDGEEQSKTVLRRDALGRTWTTPEKRESILDEFERSGLKGAQFARLAGINYGTFATWLQKRRHERGTFVCQCITSLGRHRWDAGATRRWHEASDHPLCRLSEPSRHHQ